MSLALGDWVAAGHSILITGPTGAGKSWLACALAQYACRRGYSAVAPSRRAPGLLIAGAGGWNAGKASPACTIRA
jgi:sigma54-dependent transcription regulator